MSRSPHQKNKNIRLTLSCVLFTCGLLTNTFAQAQDTQKQPTVTKPQASILAQTATLKTNKIDEPSGTKTLTSEKAGKDATPKTKSQYILEFNRSPIVGNSFHLQGGFASARLGFTRPRDWDLDAAKIVIRYQHSPALLANGSNLTVLLNGTSIGSVPLNRKDAEVGQAIFNVPPKLIGDYNEVTIVTRQLNSQNGCTAPNDPTLWTQVLPDSKILFDFQPQSIPLNFSNYPYPFFDRLSLNPNQINYLLPSEVSTTWLTAASRYQSSIGRLADFRSVETKLVKSITQVQPNQRLVIIGTPTEQPTLATLKLPMSATLSKFLDGNQNPLPDNVGVLMLSTVGKDKVPVLIASGNGPEGVNKAVQFLVQPDARKIGTEQVILVDKVSSVSTPEARQWPRFLPEKNSFKLSDIKTLVLKGQLESFQDVTVRGSSAPPVEINFHALPDDRFTRGSSMNLVYSYGPQINPRTSSVEVLLDKTFIGGARLTSEEGETRKTLNVNLPENLIKPDSKIQVYFRMNPKESFDKDRCLQPPDQQLTGTVHNDTNFDMRRESSVDLPNLKLLQVGYPFAAPQDLSTTAIVVPENPNETDVATMLAFSERLGRLSQADSVKLDVYTSKTLPPEVQKSHNLVGIGTRDRFPFPEAFQSSTGFRLSEAFTRTSADAAIQTLADNGGMVKEIMSPWNSSRVLLALSGQSETGLDKVRQVLSKDPWFLQLRDDTVLISSNKQDPVGYDPTAYKLEFFQNAPSTRRLEDSNFLSKISRFLQENWLLLPLGIVGISLLLYGVAQLYIKRIDVEHKK